MMAAHLASGCQVCADAHREWRSVSDIARTAVSYEPSEATLRLASALFSIPRAAGRIARAVEAVRTLFDSQLVAAPVGVRAAAAGRGRKVLYATGDFLVDLLIEMPRQSSRTLIIGQVVSAGEARDSVQGVPVVILRDMLVLGKAVTNGLGEFQMEFEGPSQGLSVALGLRPEGTIVSLGNPSMRS